jgi:hypothetical protein
VSGFGVLRDVLQRPGHREVHGDLDLLGVATDPIGVDAPTAPNTEEAMMDGICSASDPSFAETGKHAAKGSRWSPRRTTTASGPGARA